MGAYSGVCWRLESLAWTTFDSFGNLESRPVSSSPGNAFFGHGLHSDIQDFFYAQDVNTPLPVNTNWLLIGHVDEVVSFCSGGQRIVVADPALCWGLLLWAADVDATAIYDLHSEEIGDFLAWSSGYGTVSLREYNLLGTDNRHVSHPDNLPHIRASLALASPESTPVADAGNGGTGALSEAGAFIAFFPNSSRRYYRLTFTTGADYDLEFMEEGGAWTPGGTGSTGDDQVFPDARCFILDHWWSGAPMIGDVFTFEADPTCSTIEMPVLFCYEDRGGFPDHAGALACTINHVNSLVDGTALVTGGSFGPEVNYLGAGNGDILADYVAAAFARAGYSSVISADSTYYHDWDGDIHCGTNVKRWIPTYSWWEN
jgi:hypothetical protein